MDRSSLTWRIDRSLFAVIAFISLIFGSVAGASQGRAVPLEERAQGANEVVVATMDTDRDGSILNSLADVAVYLEHHGIKARTEMLSCEADGEGLVAFARSVHSDLIISGAYGHSRIREWAFGGVTRTLIHESGINRLLSY